MIFLSERLRKFSNRDLAIVLLLFLLALALRIPNYLTVPALTDESLEVNWGMLIAAGKQLPLVAVDSYDGPLFPYTLALLFRLFGLSLYIPRGLVVVVGALTVVATFFLAKQLARGDNRVGLLAALLLAFNTNHITYNSHIAWSNSTTPLFTTLALFAYLRATRGDSPRWLILAGALYGLALQTHPSALALAPAFIIDFLWVPSTRRQLRSLAPYLAIGAALVVYSPVIYYNLTTGFDSVHVADRHTYAFDTAPTVESTLSHVAPFIDTLISSLSSSLDRFRDVAVIVSFEEILFIVAALVGLIWVARPPRFFRPDPNAVLHADPFPLIVVSTSGLILLVFDQGYGHADWVRYIMFLLPVFYAVWAIVALQIWDSLKTKTRAVRSTTRALMLATFLCVLLIPVADLADSYALANPKRNSEAAMLKMVQTAQANPSVPIVLDPALNNDPVGESLSYYFALGRRPLETLPSDAKKQRADLLNLARTHDHLYVIAEKSSIKEISIPLSFKPVIETSFPCPHCGAGIEFGLYRWQKPSP